MDLRFNTNGVLVTPDPHDWLFRGLEIASASLLVLNFVKDRRSMRLVIPHFMGLDLVEMLPGNIIFEFSYAHVGESGYNDAAVRKFAQYYQDDIVRRASTFDLSSSYGCKLIGVAHAQRDELEISGASD
jgi:hypothetical protein